MINKFKGKYAFLSNMNHRVWFKFMYENQEFTCVESAYQAQKFTDPEYKAGFSGRNGYFSKKYGSRTKGLRPDWDDVKINVMTDLIRIKFKDFPIYRDLLVSTYPEKLVEGGVGDAYWGVNDNGIGENHLGKILMQVRDEIMAEDAAKENEK